MKKILLRTLVLGLLCAAANHSSVSAAVIYGWDFNGLMATTSTNFTPATIASTVGSGSLNVSAFGLGSPQGTSPERTSFSGATNNTFPGITDGNPGTALAIANSSANGKSMIYTFSMAGFQSLFVSLDTRGTSTGFTTGTWAWSLDNITYTPVVGNTATTSTTFSTKTVDFSGALALNNAVTAYLSYTLTGASGASGNNRIDNVVFSATAVVVPEPSTAALGLIGGVLSFLVLKRKR